MPVRTSGPVRVVGKGLEGSLAMPLRDWFLHVPSCVQEGRGGAGRACYGHLLHEVQKASQAGMLLRLRVAFAMLEVAVTCRLPATPRLTPSILGGLSRDALFLCREL